MRVKGVKANSVIAISIFISITAFAFAFHSSLFPVAPASAEPSYSTSSEVGINVKESIKIAVDKDHLALVDGEGSTQIAPSASGTLVTGDVNVAVTTNAYGGYRLGVYTSDATTDMKHNNTSVNAVVSSISGASGYDATTGISSLSPNTWGFRKYVNSDWSNWYGVGNNSTNMAIIDIKDIGEGPSTYCNDLSQPVAESGCSSSSYDTYKVGFGANLTSSLPAGTYTNNIIFSALTNEASTFLTFNANAPSGTTISGSMAPKSILKGSTVTLPNTTTFKRDGFGIKGWALTEGATTIASITQPDPENPGSTINVQLTPGATIDVDSLISAIGIPSSTTGPIPLYAVWDNAYTINYIANNPEGTTVTGNTPASTAILGLNTTIEANNYEIDGYTLKGWAFTADATDPASISEAGAKDLISGATFTTQQLITAASSAGQSVSTSTAGTIALYAVWEENAVYFQTFNSCATIPTNQANINDNAGTLVDARDDQEYTVYHFPSTGTAGTNYPTGLSNYCIMTKDLSLGYVTGGSVTKGADLTLTTDDSAAATTITARTSTSDWSGTNDDSNKQYINGPKSGSETYSSHSYYSYGAAQAVCPKGWRLPTNVEYSNIKTFMGSSSVITSAPYNFIYGGRIYDGRWELVGDNGLYWSSTQANSTGGSNLLFMRTYLGVDGQKKHVGLPVRCIAQDYGDATGYMQDFDTSSLAENESTTLVDERDNHTYKVKKLPDGKVWMINNLTLTATDLVTEGKALTSANTNIPSSDTNSYYITPKNARHTSAGDFNNSAVASASASVDFSSGYSNYIQIGYRDKNTTDNNTGNPVPEDTAYYNFYTATLGYSYSDDGKTSGSSSMDICPKGWRLPKVSDNGTSITAASSEFANLSRSYNSSASWTNANTAYNYNTTDATIRQNMIKGDASSLDPELDTNGSAGFTYAGYYISTTLYNVGTRGLYWSSSVYSSTIGYSLYFNTSNVYPQYNYGKSNGSAVRCVAQ